MYYHISIHRPKPGKAGLLLDSMHRFGAACQLRPGCRETHCLFDEEKNVCIGIAVWESEEMWQAARPFMIAAVQDDPFDDWEDHPPETFHLLEK